MSEPRDSYGTVRERTRNAVQSLADGTGDPNSRLLNAWLTLSALSADDFPAPIRGWFTALRGRLDSGEGTWEETIDQMGRDEIKQHIHKIIDIYVIVEKGLAIGEE